MSSPNTKQSTEVSLAFVRNARDLITQEYLPKIERCIERLSDEQVWWRANPESNSIGNLLLHICGNARQWIVCGLGAGVDQRQRQSEFDERRIIPRHELLLLLETTVEEVDNVLASFDPSRLLENYLIQGTQSSALEAIFHVTEHISMHTGQILYITKQLTARDMHFYDFEGDTPLLRFSAK